MNNKHLALYAFIALALLVLSPSNAFAKRIDGATPLLADVKGFHITVQEALDNDDFEAWVSLFDGQKNAQALQTEDTFDLFKKVSQLQENGKQKEAVRLLQDADLPPGAMRMISSKRRVEAYGDHIGNYN